MNQKDSLASQTSPSKGNNSAIRLSFSYEGSNIQLVSRHKIQKILPPNNTLAAQKNQGGFWYELTDDQRRLLHRQVIENPIKVDSEVFSDNTNESITRHRLSDIRGAFSIIVPDIPEGKNFDLFSSPVLSEGIRGLQKPATKIFHLDLRNDSKNGDNQ